MLVPAKESGTVFLFNIYEINTRMSYQHLNNAWKTNKQQKNICKVKKKMYMSKCEAENFD